MRRAVADGFAGHAVLRGKVCEMERSALRAFGERFERLTVFGIVAVAVVGEDVAERHVGAAPDGIQKRQEIRFLDDARAVFTDLDFNENRNADTGFRKNTLGSFHLTGRVHAEGNRVRLP